MSIVRSDAFACAGGSCSDQGIVLVNHGPCARQQAYYLVMGMAVCGDTDMAQLAGIGPENLQLWMPESLTFLFTSPSLQFERSQFKKRSEIWGTAQILFFV